MKRYYTVCTWDGAAWHDEFGAYSKAEVMEERAALRAHYKAAHLAVICHDDSAAAMIAAREALPRPVKG